MTDYSCASAQVWNQQACGQTASWLTQGLDEASMGKASRTKVDSSRRERIAAQRAAERRAEQRRRILIASGSIIAVVAIVVAFIVIKANSKPPASSASNGPTGAALASVVSDLTSVPTSTTDKIGDGGGQVNAKPKAVTGGTPLTANGKPEMLYMGAEYCPYCAAERWAMIPPYVPAGREGAIPFIYFGGKYIIAGASYNPQVLAGLSWSKIASDVKNNPNSDVAKAVVGTANYITAAICKMTGNQPSSACTSTIQSLESSLK